MIPCQFWELQTNDVFTRGKKKWRKTGKDRAGELRSEWAGEILQPNCEVLVSPTAWAQVGYGRTSFRRLRPYATFLLAPERCLLHDHAAAFGRFYITLDKADISWSAFYPDAGELTRVKMPPDTPVLNVRHTGAPRKRGCERCLGVRWVIQMQPAAANRYVVLPCPECQTFGSVFDACRAAMQCGIHVTVGASAGYIEDESLPRFLRARKTFVMQVAVTHYSDFVDPYATILSRFKRAMGGTNCEIEYTSLGYVEENPRQLPEPPRERAIQLD